MQALFRQILLLQQKDFRLVTRRKLLFLLELGLGLIFLPIMILVIIFAKEKHNITELPKINTIVPHSLSLKLSGNISMDDFEEIRKRSADVLHVNMSYNANESLSNVIVYAFDATKGLFDYRIRVPSISSGGWVKGNPFKDNEKIEIDEPTIEQQLILDRLFLDRIGVVKLKKPPRWSSGFLDLFQYISYMIVALTMTPTIFIIRDVLADRESGVRLYMMSMGVSPLADFLSQLISSSWRITFVLFAVALPALVELEEIKLPYVFLVWLFAQNSAVFALTTAQLFNHSVYASVYIFVYTVSSIVVAAAIAPPATDVGMAVLYSLMPTVALKYAIDNLLIAEQFGVSPGFFGLYPTILTWEIATLLILLNTLLLAIVCVMADSHLLRQSTAARAVINLFSNANLSLKSNKVADGGDIWAAPAARRNSKFFRDYMEPEPCHGQLQADIRVERLVKRWPDGQMAVDDVSFNVYRGQVTALLGHNGAGKSTTFACLTGSTQNNPLFCNLTVYEHVLFYLRMRNSHNSSRSANVDEAEILRILNAVGLSGVIEQFQYAQNLSGGMKRKLFVALALVGNARVILLDEPTAGMDPSARQQISKLLAAEKHNRTILLTTHYMDEADVLGDRVVIMSKGQIVCNGSTDFLKRIFGSGYVLSVTLACQTLHYGNCEQLEPLQIARRVLASVREHVRSAHFPQTLVAGDQSTDNLMKSNSEFDILLPFEERIHFADMFATLENRQDEFGVKSFGISLNSLEQVFIKVDEMASIDPNSADHADRIFQSAADQLTKEVPKVLSGATLALVHLGALSRRSVLYAWRSKVRTVMPILIAVLLFLPFYLDAYDLSNVLVNIQQGDLPIHARDIPTSRAPIFSESNGQQADRSFAAKFAQYAKDALHQLTPLHIKGTPENASDQLDAKYLQSPPYSIGFVVGDEEFIPIAIMYSIRLISSPNYALNAMSNALLHAAKKSFGHDATIHAGFKTSPKNEEIEKLISIMRDSELSVMLNVFILILSIEIVLSLLLAVFVVDVVGERANNFQHQIFLTKVTALRYWLAQYLVDFIYFVVIFVLLAALSVILVDDISTTCMASAIPIFLLYFLAAASITFMFSFLFRSPTKAFTFTFCWHTVIAVTASSILKGGVEFALKSLDLKRETLKKWNAVFSFIFELLFPSMAFNSGLFVVLTQCQRRVAKDDFDFFALYGAPMSDDELIQNGGYIGGAAVEVAILATVALICMTALALIQWRRFVLRLHRWSHRKYQKLCHPPLEEESDVTAERQAVAAQSDSRFALAVRDLYKFYNEKICAVRDLTFSVRSDECFGLLGVNGAGKTSTFDILTSVAYPTAGTATIYGVSVDERPSLGYCPQFDALASSLTGRETLTLIGQLNGLVDVDWRVNKVLESIRLDREADKLVGNYSGGQKRRMSIGVALMSCARLIMLDEPTAGVDPSTRRHVWNLLSALRHRGTALLLTTHSMEECEALCTKVGFMSRGVMISIGTNQYLKDKFGNSFLLTVTPQQPSAAFGRWLNRLVTEEFNAPALLDDALNSTTLAWQIPRQSGDRWSVFYRRVDALMAYCERVSHDELADYGIRDYSLVQSSMEQVFVHLVNM